MEGTKFISELSPTVFSVLLLSVFTRPQLVSFCSRHGLKVPGFRLEKLEVTELIEMVYEACSRPGLPAAALQEELDRRYREKLEKLKGMSEGKVKKLFRDDADVEVEDLVGYLWAAGRDERPRVNREAIRLADFLEGLFCGGAAAEDEAAAAISPPAGEESPGERKTGREAADSGEGEGPAGDDPVPVLSGLYQLGEQWGKEIRKVEKYLKKTAAEAGKARRAAEKRKKEVRERNEQVRLLREEVKKLKKELQEREKSRGPAAPLKEIAALKSRLHGLEREGRKKDHEIAEWARSGEKLRKLEEKIRTGEAELAAARRRIGELESGGRELEGEAAALKEKIVRLEKSRAAVFTRTRPPHDRERLGIYYDSRNIYYTVRNTFQGARVDIEELLTRIVRGRKLVRAMAYVVQADFDNKEPYFDLLAHRGFQVKRRNLKVRQDGSMKGDWDMGIALDLIRHCGDLDTIALVSGDGDFRDLAVFLQGRGVRVEVYGVESCTALDLKQAADLFVPIDQAWLFTRPSA